MEGFDMSSYMEDKWLSVKEVSEYLGLAKIQ